MSNQSEAMRRKYGDDIYKKMGAKGGSTKTEKTKLRGFANPNHPRRKKYV